MTRVKTYPALALAAALVVGGCGTDAPPEPGAAATTASAAALAEPAAVNGDPAAAVPSATSTVGLVDGFPTDLVPVLTGATVTASAVRVDGDRIELSLSGRTRRSRKAVLAFYADAFRRAGFTKADGRKLAPGTPGQVWARGEDVIVVAVGTGTRRSFSVGGTVTP